MKYIGNVQSQAESEVYAVASGALPDGKPVVVNSNGTVSVIAQTSATQNIGSEVIYEAGDSSQTAAAYDPSIDRIVIAFMDDDNSQDGTAVVGTVSGDSISFGTPTVFSTAALQTSIGIVYDASAGKVVVFYQGASSHGKARVCTVDPSDNSITFGTEASFNAASTNYIAASYDANAQKTVIQYQHSSTGVAIVGTVSGTDISFGSSTQFSSSNIVYGSNAYDSTAQKVIIAYRGASNYGRARVATISGTSVSFGTEVVFESATSNEMKVSYDANSNRTVIVYSDQGNSNQGTAIVGTVSGTDISFGTAVVFNADTTATTSIVYDSTAKKVVIAYPDGDGDGSDNGKLIVGTVSGTSISFGTPVVFEAGIVGNPSCFISSAFDSTANRCVIAYGDRSDSNKGKAVVFQNTFTSTNLTTENFLGFTNAAYATGQTATIQAGGAINTVDTEVVTIGFLLSAASYDNKSLSVNSSETKPVTIAVSTDGTKLFIAGQTGDAVDQWTLSTPFDVSTGSYDSVTFSYASSAGTNVEGMFFKPDGTKFFLTDDQNKRVYAYTMSSAYNLATTSYDSVSFNIASQASANPKGIAFNSDGTKFFVLGFPSGTATIFQYNLSTAYNIATASYSNNSLNVNSQVSSGGGGIQFNGDDTKFYVSSNSADDIFQYNMTSAGDLSTASYSSVNFRTASQTSAITNFYWGNSGQKLYAMSYSNDTVFQYSTSSSVGGPITAGQQYFVQGDGTIGTTAATPSVIAGTAVSATDLIVKG